MSIVTIVVASLVVIGIIASLLIQVRESDREA